MLRERLYLSAHARTDKDVLRPPNAIDMVAGVGGPAAESVAHVGTVSSLQVDYHFELAFLWRCSLRVYYKDRL